MRQKLLKGKHPDIAETINNQARLYRAMGAYEKAEPLYLSAFIFERQRLGPIILWSHRAITVLPNYIIHKASIPRPKSFSNKLCAFRNNG